MTTVSTPSIYETYKKRCPECLHKNIKYIYEIQQKSCNDCYYANGCDKHDTLVRAGEKFDKIEDKSLCGHSICISCWTKLYYKYREGKIKKIKCPTCKMNVHKWAIKTWAGW